MKALKALGQTFAVSKKSILLFEACLLGGSVFGALLEGGIYLITGEQVMGLASIFAIMAMVVMVMFGSVFGGYSDFAMAVYFQRSRKNYVCTKYIYYVVEYIVGLLLIGASYMLEAKLAKPEAEMVLTLGDKLPAALAFVFVVPLVVILFSALYAKYERKFFWVMWVLWMVVFTGGPRMMVAMENHPESVIAKIGFFLKKALVAGSLESTVVVVIIAIIVIVANVLVYRNVDVRD